MQAVPLSERPASNGSTVGLMILTILIWIVLGFVIGLVARALVPGNDAMGFIPTVVLGIVGSFVGGFIASLFSGGDALELRPAGVILSIVGAIVALLLYRAVARRA